MPDIIERELETLAATLQDAWMKTGCLTCPLGEMAALAAAVLMFYREQKHDARHWSTELKDV